MPHDDDLYRDPSKETKLRWQNDKETLGAASSGAPPPWKVGDRLEDFVLEELLGSGSSGVVYRALDVKTNHRCALKMLKQGPPDELLRNKLGFRRMMSLQHPHLVRVDRIYQLGSYIALSMEEINGLTLNRAIEEATKLDSDLVYQNLLRWMRDFASGLSMMHASGYIHRDIKPENLMVDRQGDGRVIDYGLVDAFDLDRGSFGVRGFLLGTPHYFAPEVIWDQRYLPASDIFSLGIVMLDALRAFQQSSPQQDSGGDRSDTHHPLPFETLEPDWTTVQRFETNQVADAEHIDEAIQDLSESIPSKIRDACREMLDRDPGLRPTALELSRLGLPAGGQPVWLREQPMVGRASELQEISVWLDGIFDGDTGRLHLTGPAGIGKSRLIDAVVGYIESKKWGQVFCARCSIRDDQPLRAFDQLCDGIANRYMKGDRERLELDPASVGMLQEIFPVLKNILTCNLQVPPPAETTERWDSLEAAARLSEQLRLVGPLFLVIDDSQWADRDSLSVLDRLQSAIGQEGLGIITVSRQSQDPQRVPASKYMTLKPLGDDDAVQVLADAAQRWPMEVTPPMLRKLAHATNGIPFRLRELADEFRPGGFLADLVGCGDSAVDELGQLDRLWHERAKRLSDEAKSVLTFVVTAGTRVSTQQLGELTGLKDSVDVAVSELARRRLVTDEATGGECIEIFHDHVADELVNTFSEQVRRNAHHAWALLLIRQERSESSAARIANHFIAANEPGRAVAHAIMAAEDAERRFAPSEAARWYARVIDDVDGEERINLLRNAAKRYHEADFPVKAAKFYQQLSELVDDHERVECRLLATALLIRCGRFKGVRDQLHELAQTLGLPKPKSTTLGSRLAAAARGWQMAISGKRSLLDAMVHPPALPGDQPTTPSQPSLAQPHADQAGQRLRLCLSLVRPMSMFDNDYASELNAAAVSLATKHGDPEQKVRAAVWQAVRDCYDNGHRRLQGEITLMTLKPYVEQLGSSQASGDLWAGYAYSHAFACRWHLVSQPVQSSTEHYRAAVDSHGFEAAHTQWLDLWATWHLGRWKSMQKTSHRMFDDATRRSDLFQQIMTSSGYGGAAWLARDKQHELARIQMENAKADCNNNQMQMLHVFSWIASIQLLLFEGKYADAWAVYEAMRHGLHQPPFSKIQLIRVSGLALGSLVALHNLASCFSETWLVRVQVLTHQLRQQRIGFAKTLANLYQGLLQRKIAEYDQSTESLDRARKSLLDARDGARDHRLRPYQLAAEDALAEIHTGASLGRLADRMKSQNVVPYEALQRLYTPTSQ